MIKSMMRWVGHVARMIHVRNAYIIFVGKLEERRQLGRPRRGWEDNITMDIREIRREGVDWMHLAQDRDQWGGGGIVKTVNNLWVPKKLEKLLNK
jgi:hypothetical protein